MAKDPRQKTTEGGLELDKINLLNLSSDSTREPMSGDEPAGGADGRKPSSTPEDSLRDKKKSSLPLLTALAILALLMAVTAVFKKQDFSFTFLSGESSAPLENYLRVGPVTTTLANEDIVKFSIDIDCGNAELKEQLAGKDSQIRDKIIAVLTEPGTDTLIKEHDYEAVKTKIKERLGELGAGPIDDVYFSELLMY